MKELEALFATGRPPALMRAALLQEAGRPLLLCDVPVPALTAGQLLVRLDACGICHTDLHVQGGGSPAHRPLILGHEGIGRVADIAPGVDGWRLGDRIGVPWLHDTCGHCRECLSGAESFCQAQRAHGYNVDGAFAEYVAVDARYAVRLPETIDPIEAAPLMCAGVTAYGAVRTARIGLGSVCAIFGCGGLGLFAVQLAVRAGATVVALDIAPSKLDRARELGAHHAVLVDDETIGRLKALGGVSAAINFAPTDATWPIMLAAIRPRGVIVAAAMVAKPVQVSQEWLAATGVTITGTSVGTRLEMEELMRLHADRPILSETQTLALSGVNEGLERLSRGEVAGRLVIDLHAA